MKPNELRIGNIISYSDGTHHTVSKFDDHKVWFEKVTNQHGVKCWIVSNIEDVAPIPLTEELLLKCGFKSVEHGMTIRGYYYYKKPISIYLIKDGVEAEVSLCDDTINLSKNSPQYLHQLQNLYFAITGEELTIEL